MTILQLLTPCDNSRTLWAMDWGVSTVRDFRCLGSRRVDGGQALCWAVSVLKHAEVRGEPRDPLAGDTRGEGRREMLWRASCRFQQQFFFVTTQDQVDKLAAPHTRTPRSVKNEHRALRTLFLAFLLGCSLSVSFFFFLLVW